ncbi:Uncharacterised protein [Vibrio cholerae]|nr:Uncharacterised protein [Vibrio cholerae]
MHCLIASTTAWCLTKKGKNCCQWPMNCCSAPKISTVCLQSSRCSLANCASVQVIP